MTNKWLLMVVYFLPYLLLKGAPVVLKGFLRDTQGCPHSILQNCIREQIDSRITDAYLF